jgi:hypothetical protein
MTSPAAISVTVTITCSTQFQWRTMMQDEGGCTIDIDICRYLMLVMDHLNVPICYCGEADYLCNTHLLGIPDTLNHYWLTAGGD